MKDRRKQQRFAVKTSEMKVGKQEYSSGMPQTSIEAKLLPPVLSIKHLSRLALIEKLNSRENCKLTLVSAPAGYGKTTLLSEWAAGHDGKIAWLSLEQEDNDPTRFWSYVIASFQKINNNLVAALQPILQSPHHFSTEVFLAELIDEVSELQKPLTIILDDYQAIDSKAIHEMVFKFITWLPDRVNLIISSRSDPPFPLGRLRSMGVLCELRIDDIRFNLEETTLFLNQAVEWDLSADQIRFLYRKTEGWIAGLQLSAFSMRNYGDKSKFFASFAGDDRFIADYLVQEVLRQQPEQIRSFLLQTSLLKVLSDQVCQAATGIHGCQEILEYLEDNNLFLISLDRNRRWYRYHHLFSELLRRRLVLEHPAISPSIHRSASQWFESNHLVDQAIYHALEIEDYERAASLIQGIVLGRVNRGEFETIRYWLEKLPGLILDTHPWLGIARAWELVFSGQLDFIQEEINQLASNVIPDSANQEHIRGHLFAIKACLSSLSGDQVNALKHSQDALSFLPEEDYFARGISSLILGLSLRWKGDLSSAIEAYTIAQQVSKKGEDSFVYIYSSSFKGYVMVLQGHLKEGYEEYRSALRSFQRTGEDFKRESPMLGLIHSFLSDVLLRWNKVELAFEQAQKGLELSKRWGNRQAINDGYFFLIQALMAKGDVPGAKRAIEGAKENAEALPRFQQLDIFYLEGLLYLTIGNLDHVAGLIREFKLHPKDELGYIHLQTYQILAGYLRKSGDIEKSTRLLTRLLQIAEETGARSKELEISIQLALALSVKKDDARANKAINSALAIAEPEGNLYPFLREGELLIDLLQYAASRGLFVSFIGEILRAYNGGAQFGGRRQVEGNEDLISPLTAREFQVLCLLAVGLSSTEIARELVISVGTARTHIKNLYRKLDVHKRVEAVSKAKELSLI
jgi:LuxR family maltose regulon positive regulatory protein